MRKINRFIPLVIIIIALFLFFYFDLDDYLSFTALKKHHDILITWTKSHYFYAVSLFMLVYLLVVAISLPGATFLTLVSGFLFGIILGTLYTIISATLGAMVIFLAIKWAFSSILEKKVKRWISPIEQGFKHNAMSYLLFLRLVPLFPFWVVNIVPALINVPLSTFMISTCLGIIPGALVYASVGNGFGSLFARGEKPNLQVIFEPQILVPLFALALLCLIPIFYKRTKKNSR